MEYGIRAVVAGRDLLDALAELFPDGEAWVQASGYVEDVELRLPASSGDVRTSYKGRFALAQLSGPRGGPYGVTLCRSQGTGLELLAGVLVRARSAGISAFCSSAVPSPAPAVTEFPQIAPVAGAGASSGADGGAGGEDDLDDHAHEPERGDLVDHFAFGFCEVLNASGDRLMIRDLTKTGRVLEIRTHLLVVHPPREHEGKRLFRLTRRG